MRIIAKTLFDSGATGNMLKRTAILKGAKIMNMDNAKRIQTTNGSLRIMQYIKLDKLVFPEFSPNCYINNVRCYIFDDSQVRYDLIIGRRTMKTVEFTLDFKEEKMKWIDKDVPFCPVNWYSDKEAIRKVLTISPRMVQPASGESCGRNTSR